MKTRILFLLSVAAIGAATASAASYSYSTYNPSGTAFAYGDMNSWTKNASISCASNSNGCPIYSADANGGSFILTTAPQVDSEVNITLSSAIGSSVQGGVGGAVIYVHASSNALSTPAAHADTGSFDALQIYQPWCAPDGSCYAYWALYERTAAGSSRVVSASTMQYWAGMPVRVVTYGTTFAFLANDQLVTLPVTLAGGHQGVGAFGNAGGAIAAVQVGPRCMTVPNAVASTNVTISAYPTNISMNWPETPQPADVAAVGITEWLTQKNGSSDGTLYNWAAWDDPNVVPSSTYTYSLAPVSFHGVAAAYSGTLTVKTPSALNVDPVRTGVRPLGAYWGSAPENIDMASGNLNLTIPLLRPQGRGGWSVPIALTYNSQIWKSDSAGIQNMGLDVGYGYGWKMLAGSLTPFWNPASAQLDHYLYTDATGGQYRLYQSGVGNVWISHLYPASSGLSGEAIYVYYDSDTNLLHFRDGSSWYMGCMSSGEEQDAGTMYPTILEDRNGNQVIVTYGPGLGTSLYSASPTAVAINSSARIYKIEDTRATGSPRTTYNFAWSAPDANGIQHVASITNTIGTSETYAFSFVQGLPFHDPWGGTVQAPYATGLSKITNSALNTYYSIYTDNSGQMGRLELPYGGYIGWGYGTNTYQWPSSSNTIKLNAVNIRVLASAAGASNSANSGGNPTQWSYPITYTAPLTNGSVVAGSCVTDSGAAAERCWTFGNGGSTGVAFTTGFSRWGNVNGTMTQLRSDALTYAPDGAGNSVLIQDLTTDYTGPSGNVYSQTAWAVDQYGNNTSTLTWDYSTSLPGSTPTRTLSTTYQDNCSSPWTGSNANNCPDVNVFLLSLPLQTTLTAGSVNTVLASNTYDTYTKYYMVGVSGLYELDSFALNAQIPRGNVTQAVRPGSTTNYQFDITGMVLQADDNNGHAVSITAASGMNNTVPGNIQPNTGSSGDGSLATALSYTPFLGVSSAVAPNASTASTTYDSAGRVSTTQVPSHSTDGSVAGATTSYAYAFGTTVGGNITNGAYTTTATTGTHWSTSVTDGLGRAATQTTGYGTTSPTTVSTVDTVYGPCACSPAGKMVRASQPYAPGGTEVWTVYTYDYMGRTLTVTLPDGASTTRYTYQGNWTTVVDPAGKWKQYQSDVFGNVVNVVEPDPLASPVLTTAPASPSTSGSGTLVTSYVYDSLNHLINVSMPRGSVTQTRTFTYDPATLLLTSMTSPETGTSSSNGTTSYTYNVDGTLATRTDPKGQITTYTYDTYQRVTKVTHGPSATQTYSNQTYNYTYDSGTNGWGRLTGVSFGPLTIGNAPATESYSYTVAGDMSAKTLVNKWSLSASFTYDSEGKPVTTTYPGWGYSGTGLVQTNAYDAMSRLISVSNIEALGTVSGCTPTPPTSGTVTWAQGARYNSAGQLTDLERFGSGGNTCAGLAENYFNEHWNYNALNQLTEIDTSSQSLGFPVPSPNPGTANVFFSRYNFSATANNWQVASVDDARQSGANIVYTYDALKRLTNATTAAWTQTIGYDGFGNITSKTVPPTSAEPAFPGAVSAKNWLAGVSYDLNGNALAVNAFALTYDVENRLATATSGTAVESYLYDESNHRVEKTIGSSDYLYFYGPGGRLLTILQLWAGTTSLVANRMYFGGLLLGSAGPGVWNDVSTMTDRLGTAVTGYPYGTDIGSVSASNDQPDFATYTKDSTTGFEYANQRYYSAGLGRFLTADPYNGSGVLADPTSLNRFSYVGDDPINQNDASGLCPALIAGVRMNAPGLEASSDPFQDFGLSIGATTAYGFGAGLLADVPSVIAQGLGFSNASTSVAAEAFQTAAATPGGVTLIGYSGGAQSASTLAGDLSPGDRSRITGAIYIDPGTIGSPFIVPGNTVVVLGKGAVSNVARFFNLILPGSVTEIDTQCAHTDVSCFVKALNDSPKVPLMLKNVLNGGTPCNNQATYSRSKAKITIGINYGSGWLYTPGPPVGPDPEGRLPDPPEMP